MRRVALYPHFVYVNVFACVYKIKTPDKLIYTFMFSNLIESIDPFETPEHDI